MKFLFVCTGNTCRSPMAEGILNALSSGAGAGHEALSCGVAAIEGSGATGEAALAALAHGADISAHRARADSEELLAWADAVLCMTEAHRLFLEEKYPAHSSKLRVISPPVPDPFGRGQSVYQKTADAIRAALEKLL